MTLVDGLNEQLSWDQNQCMLSPCHRHLALIMNLLTESVALYRLREFFENTDTQHLFGEGITFDYLNDDALGRGLDQFSRPATDQSSVRCSSKSLPGRASPPM